MYGYMCRAVCAILWCWGKGLLSKLEGRARDDGAVVGAVYGQVGAANPQCGFHTCEAARQCGGGTRPGLGLPRQHEVVKALPGGKPVHGSGMGRGAAGSSPCLHVDREAQQPAAAAAAVQNSC